MRLFSIIFILTSAYLSGQELYFPPLVGNQWESRTLASLNWCEDELQPLYEYLDAEESKAFIVLKEGRIVIEKYFDTFTRDSFWYWASAGKTLTAFLTGMAQQDGVLSLNDPSSDYLGKGWTTLTAEQEEKITIRHQLTMTTGLNDLVADNHCTLPACLEFKAKPGDRWAYHNAPYTLLRNVLESATGLNENIYIQQKLKSRTGMNGLWFTSGWDNVYASNARSMARFGLLILNHGVWDKDSLMRDQSFFTEMVNSSQSINESYGYLWWLNGKSSFMLPGLQLKLPGSYAPEAPKDMFAAIGKNGQILCIVPSQQLVVLRMGEANGTGFDDVPITLCNQMWLRLNKVLCNQPVSTFGGAESDSDQFIYPNPANDRIFLTNVPLGSAYAIFNATGQLVKQGLYQNSINISDLKPGIHYINYIYNRKSQIFFKW